MTAGDFGDKIAQGIVYVGQRLSWHRLGKEDHEIDRMALVHSHADFAVVLEAANARPVPCARIDDDDRRFRLVHAILPAIVSDSRDPEQRIIGGPVESAGIHQELVIEIQKRWHALPFMRYHVVGAFPQGIEEQQPAFEGVLGVGDMGVSRGLLRLGFRSLLRCHSCKAHALIHRWLPSVHRFLWMAALQEA